MSKQSLGQFYTTNYEYILSNMTIPDSITNFIEPFVGTGELLKFIKNKDNKTIEMYDIDPKCDDAITRDTLKNPPDYKSKFVLTNPPYLARNKNKNKELYDLYDCNDLYKCFIITLINNVCLGGIIIVPLNFLCSIRKADVELRKKFLEVYHIHMVNIFEERVFKDTSYSVCSIYFIRKTKSSTPEFTTFIYPIKKTLTLSLSEKNNYTIGGEIYNLPQNKALIVKRATKETSEHITNILLKCMDDNVNNKLGFSVVSDNDRFIDNTPNLSARSYATLVINKQMTIQEQIKLVIKMNDFINKQRKKYHSLFLTNYRESTTIARKRISFKLAFEICNYILSLDALDES